MSNCTCSLCKRVLDDEKASLLTVSGVGNKRYICEECETVLRQALESREVDEIADAMERIGEIMQKSDVEDDVVISEMNNLLGAARERAERIRSGEYDFSLDEEEPQEELPELLMEAEPEPELTEEERQKREKHEKIVKIVDKVSTWLSVALIGGVILYFIITLIF